MIHLQHQKQANLDLSLSLDEILFKLKDHSEFYDCPFDYSYQELLSLNRKIGYSNLSAVDLIPYPQLCNALRQLTSLTYGVRIDLSHLPDLKMRGIKQTIEALKKLDALLEQDRHTKAALDAKVNNLIMLYGQQKEHPIFQGCKPYFSIKERPYVQHSIATSYQTQICGVKYYINTHRKRFKDIKSLYELNDRTLFLSNEDKKRNFSVYHIRFIGGIIHTPILAFRAKQNWKHKGKRYFLDLYTNQKYTRLNDIHTIAKHYAKNYQIKLIEDIKK